VLPYAAGVACNVNASNGAINPPPFSFVTLI